MGKNYRCIRKVSRQIAMKKLIIIPAYNEESNIVKTVTAIQEEARGFDYN